MKKQLKLQSPKLLFTLKPSDMKLASLCIMWFCLCVASCKKTEITVRPITVDVTEVKQIAEMNQRFGWDLFQSELKAKPQENVLISPWSIQTAIHMASNGAQKNTLVELLAAISCPNCSVSDINEQQNKLNTILTKQSGHPELTIANAFFYDPNRISVLEAFKSPLGKLYDAQVQSQNFGDEATALAAINEWTKTSTKGKIPAILDKITTEDVAFLINALYFKADWASPFAVASTSKRDFLTAKGQTSKVDMMTSDDIFSFSETAKFRMVDLPFRDSTFSLTVVQASLSTSSVLWQNNLNDTDLSALYAGVKRERAIVNLPKFKLRYENDLISSLKNLGVKDAFSENTADFGLMGSAQRNIFINQIKHKAVLEIDEKGAEGAAVTSIGFGVTSVPPTFTFDQPFVVVLRHIPTGTLIFTGYIADPKY
jgi:serine protease inhibitor